MRMARPHESAEIPSSVLPARSSSMNHPSQVAGAPATADFNATTTTTPNAPSRPISSPTLNRNLPPPQSYDEFQLYPPTPLPPPTQPLPPPPTSQRPRVASATIARPRAPSNGSVKPRPRASSNASLARGGGGGSTSSPAPPAARSSGAARRGTVGSHPPTYEFPERERERSESPPNQRPQPPQTPEQLMRMIRERTRDSYTRIRERPSAPNLSPRRDDFPFPQPPPRSASTRSAPLDAGHAPNDSFGSGHAKYSSHAMKGGFHSIAAGPIVPSVPTHSGEPGCFTRKKGLGGLEGYKMMGDTDGPRPKWDMNDGSGVTIGNTSRSYGTDSRRGAGTPVPGKGNKVVSGFKQKLKHILHGFHISVSVSFNDRPQEFARYHRTEMTLRIKNNLHGSCIFDVMTSEEERGTEEMLEPVDNLKYLFPQDKNLQKALHEWNRHFQNPPPHWVVNFVPRAYLRRGYNLAEDVLEYFNTHPDGCDYTIEYEPIGHEPCLVGTVVGRRARSRNARRPGEQWWEGKEKF